MRIFDCRLVLYALAVLCSATAFADTDVQLLRSALEAHDEAAQQGQVVKQLIAAEQAWELGQKLFSEKDSRLTVLASNYAVALALTRQERESLSMFRRALKLGEKAHGKDSLELLPTLDGLIAISNSNTHGSQRRKYLDRKIGIIRKQYGKLSREYADALRDAPGKLPGFAHKRVRASYYRKAIDVYTELAGETDLLAADTAILLARDYQRHDEDGRAEKYLELALSAYLEHSDPGLSRLIKVRKGLAEVYRSRGARELAERQIQSINELRSSEGDQDALLLIRESPQFPDNVSASAHDVWIAVQYDIDENGRVTNTEVVDSGSKPVDVRLISTLSPEQKLPPSNSDIRKYGAAARRCVRHWRFAPRVIDGKVVVTENRIARIEFAALGF